MSEQDKAAVDAWAEWFKARFHREPTDDNHLQDRYEITAFGAGFAAGEAYWRGKQGATDLESVEYVTADCQCGNLAPEDVRIALRDARRITERSGDD